MNIKLDIRQDLKYACCFAQVIFIAFFNTTISIPRNSSSEKKTHKMKNRHIYEVFEEKRKKYRCPLVEICHKKINNFSMTKMIYVFTHISVILRISFPIGLLRKKINNI